MPGKGEKSPGAVALVEWPSWLESHRPKAKIFPRLDRAREWWKPPSDGHQPIHILVNIIGSRYYSCVISDFDGVQLRPNCYAYNLPP